MEPVESPLSYEAQQLLELLKDCHIRQAFAMACDGRVERKAAHELEELKYAEWKGTSFGSSFYAITELGLTHG